MMIINTANYGQMEDRRRGYGLEFSQPWFNLRFFAAYYVIYSNGEKLYFMVDSLCVCVYIYIYIEFTDFLII